MAEQRFELSDGKSHKFWTVDVQGSDVHLHWGRIGTNGQSKVKELGSTSAALAEAQKLIKGKTKKGYVEVASGPGTAPSPKPAPPAKDPPRPAAVTTDPAPDADAAPPPPPPDDAPAAAAPSAVAVTWPDESDFSPPKSWHRDTDDTTAQAGPPMTVGEAWAALQQRWSDGGLSEVKLLKGLIVKEHPAFKRLINNDRPPPEPDLQFSALLGVLSAATSLSHPPRGAEAVAVWMTHGPLHAIDAAFAYLEASHRVRQLRREHEIMDPLAARLRALSDEEADAATARLQQLATDDAIARYHAASLAPRANDWAHHLLTDARYASWREKNREALTRLVHRSDCRPEHIAALVDCPYLWGTNWHLILAKGGMAAAEYVLSETRLAQHLGPDTLALIPSDAATRALVEQALRGERHHIAAFDKAAARFPQRALRVLAPHVVQGHSGAQRLAKRLVLTWPGIVDKLGEALSPQAVQALSTLGPEEVPEAALEDLPEILRTPPWMDRPPEPKMPKLDLVAPVTVPSLTWTDEERTAIIAASRHPSYSYYSHGALHQLAWGADKEIKNELQDKSPFTIWDGGELANLPRALERHGLGLLPRVYGGEYLGQVQGPLLQWSLYLADSHLVPIAAKKLRTKRDRRPAVAWLNQHPQLAAQQLIPVAFGKKTKKKERDDAVNALLFLLDGPHRQVVLQVATGYSSEVLTALEAKMAIGPLHRLPSKLPPIPPYVVVEGMTRPQLKAGGALPVSATEHVLTMLALSTLEEAYPGLAEVQAACTPASLSQFSWALFEEWEAQGMPSKEGWLFEQVAHLGDDAAARALAKRIKLWPGEGGHARAVKGLDVLAALGSDVALMQIYAMSLKLKFKGLKKNAGEKVAEIGEARGLTADQMADRLVPRFDLDDDGRMQLDYGARTFTVGFDEQLKPLVLDQEGKRLKNLPKPGKKDDPEVAKPAEARFKALKKDVRDVAKQQLLRFEQIMVRQRRWPVDDFEEFVVRHPLLVHLARRLVFGQFDDSGTMKSSFRVAEDRSYADVEDEEVGLRPELTVGVPHRLDFDDGVASAWSDVLADYGLLQPFAHLARQTFPRDEQTGEKTALDVVENKTVATSRVTGLERRGWQKGEAQDGGCIWWMQRTLDDGRVLYLSMEPGIIVGLPGEHEEQTLGKVTLHKNVWWPAEKGETMSTLSPIQFSELMLDLSTLTAG